jgi:hypothetical protein
MRSQIVTIWSVKEVNKAQRFDIWKKKS